MQNHAQAGFLFGDLILSYHDKEAPFFFTVDPYYGNLNKTP